MGCLGALDDTYIDVRVPAEDRARYRTCKGNYYLVDNGYSNGKGFLSPYRGLRYHLKEWDSGCNAPHNQEEYFNMKHARARNVIKRTFDLLKARWVVLRSPAFYSINVQNRIIMVCCLLHNFIRIDPMEQVMNDELVVEDDENVEYLGTVDSNPIWNNWRDEIAMRIYNIWHGEC
ncbi:UNVERIFIED_CONTAM: hypothetical protein Sradi_5080600 [Sesamum radiatum]|uniref:DDE Tnp4 domain-containing protein n=1 Tax=Sesamum radiatum TaxID=300843 RepID=A0AAW2M255_SESRA